MPLKRIIQNDKYWEVKVAFCMMGAPMMRLLRLSDRHLPGMDKVGYFVDKAEDTIIKKADHLNKLFPLPADPAFKESIWQEMIDFLSSSKAVVKTADEEKTAFNTDLRKVKSTVHNDQIATPATLASLTKFHLPNDKEGTDSEEELMEEEEEEIDRSFESCANKPRRHICGPLTSDFLPPASKVQTSICTVGNGLFPMPTHHASCQRTFDCQ